MGNIKPRAQPWEQDVTSGLFMRLTTTYPALDLASSLLIFALKPVSRTALSIFWRQRPYSSLGPSQQNLEQCSPHVMCSPILLMKYANAQSQMTVRFRVLWFAELPWTCWSQEYRHWVWSFLTVDTTSSLSGLRVLLSETDKTVNPQCGFTADKLGDPLWASVLSFAKWGQEQYIPILKAFFWWSGESMSIKHFALGCQRHPI